jgi:hypothetical protein
MAIFKPKYKVWLLLRVWVGIVMARKNTLSEVKGFGVKSGKTKSQAKPKKQESQNQVSQQVNQWEAWQYRGDFNNLVNWRQVWVGTLEDCFEALYEPIHCQLEKPLIEDGTLEELIAKYDNDDTHEPEVLLEILGKLTAPKITKLKAQCLENGECSGEGWAIAAAPSKFKQQINNLYPFTYSDEWEVGELLQEDYEDYDDEEVAELYDEEEFDDGLGENIDDEGGEDDESGNWGYVADGSLSDCLEAIMPFLTIELEIEERQHKHISDDMDIKSYFESKTKKRSQRLEEIKKACLTNGECKGDDWIIRSVRTREQCEWLAKNGYPVVS